MLPLSHASSLTNTVNKVAYINWENSVSICILNLCREDHYKNVVKKANPFFETKSIEKAKLCIYICRNTQEPFQKKICIF